jgi:hypothetical protein
MSRSKDVGEQHPSIMGVTEKTTSRSTANSGTIPVGGELRVSLLGFGAMGPTGDGTWDQLGIPRIKCRSFAAPSKLSVNFKNTPASWIEIWIDETERGARFLSEIEVSL